jgi:hypothetical protein
VNFQDIVSLIDVGVLVVIPVAGWIVNNSLKRAYIEKEQLQALLKEMQQSINRLTVDVARIQGFIESDTRTSGTGPRRSARTTA